MDGWREHHLFLLVCSVGGGGVAFVRGGFEAAPNGNKLPPCRGSEPPCVRRRRSFTAASWLPVHLSVTGPLVRRSSTLAGSLAAWLGGRSWIGLLGDDMLGLGNVLWRRVDSYNSSSTCFFSWFWVVCQLAGGFLLSIRGLITCCEGFDFWVGTFHLWLQRSAEREVSSSRNTTLVLNVSRRRSIECYWIFERARATGTGHYTLVNCMGLQGSV